MQHPAILRSFPIADNASDIGQLTTKLHCLEYMTSWVVTLVAEATINSLLQSSLHDVTIKFMIYTQILC
jgi:hypothetical protein